MTFPGASDPIARHLRANAAPLPADLAGAFAAYDATSEAGYPRSGPAWTRLVEAGNRHGLDIEAMGKSPGWTLRGQAKQMLASGSLLRRLAARATA